MSAQMHAIIDLNGKQYQVQEGRYVTVDRLSLGEKESLEISNVMMIVDGEASVVGAPYIEGATVKAKVLRHLRGPKILVYKMRCKKGYRRKNGHRQDYTQLQIEVVDFPGKAERPAAAEAPVTEAPKGPSKTALRNDEKIKKQQAERQAAKEAAAKTSAPEAEKKAKAPKAEEAVVETAAEPVEAAAVTEATQPAPAEEAAPAATVEAPATEAVAEAPAEAPATEEAPQAEAEAAPADEPKAE